MRENLKPLDTVIFLNTQKQIEALGLCIIQIG